MLASLTHTGPNPASALLIVAIFLSAAANDASLHAQAFAFDPENDLLALHYDHAPDKDDGQSAAADRTILESLFNSGWIEERVVAVSGTYGQNSRQFDPGSDRVMDAVWNDVGGWYAAHPDPKRVLDEVTARWLAALEAGGDVWVKEGGQSDLTAEIVQRVRDASLRVDTRKSIHVVQHSQWNEDQTTDAALAYVRENTDYNRIRDANAYLNIEGGNPEFVTAAVGDPRSGAMWRAAFAYYDPEERLDFSDTGELMFILGLGELDVSEFQERFLYR